MFGTTLTHDDKQHTALFDTAFTFVPRELGVGTNSHHSGGP